ncbi:hypothetical protein DFH06DRAFT_1360474 [Mycena polygramma]|nr:hypothetical protein DFH06DRAFT_1360474 [Mycena polygramma]
MSPDFGLGNNSPMMEVELSVLPRCVSSTTDHDTTRAPPAGGTLRLRSRRSTPARTRTVLPLHPGTIDTQLHSASPLPTTHDLLHPRRPPPWPGADDEDDMGLESVSDPEEEGLVDDLERIARAFLEYLARCFQRLARRPVYLLLNLRARQLKLDDLHHNDQALI